MTADYTADYPETAVRANDLPAPAPRQSSLFGEGEAGDTALGGRDALLLPPLSAPPAPRRSIVAQAERVTDTLTPPAVFAPVAAFDTAPRLAPIRLPVSSDHLYLTADLRAETGLPRTAMDFYLRVGLIRPTTRAESGYLLFDARELTILRRVIEWRGRGIGLREIAERLGRPAPPRKEPR